MIIRKFVLVVALAVAASSAFAQGPKSKAPVASDASATSDDEAACRPPARKFCHKVLEEGKFSVLACLQENRAKIGDACRDVLERNGK